MYSEEIKYVSFDSDENTHVNKIRNTYFENRSCLINVLDFLDQEVVIIPQHFFSYEGGIIDAMKERFVGIDIDLNGHNWELYSYPYEIVDWADCYHLSILDKHITIVASNYRCIFTNKYMGEDSAFGTIVSVKNFDQLLKKFGDRNLKRISKAIVCPIVKKTDNWDFESECLDEEFFFSMDIYKPEVIFKYSIDTYMSNVCIGVYNKLVKIGLNGLVDKYIPKYKCDCNIEKDSGMAYNLTMCKCRVIEFLAI